MAWMRIESGVARHPKFQAAGPVAAWLWICGLAYCQETLTDGVIMASSIRYLGVLRPERAVNRLLSCGLWERVDGGYRIHDYLEHQRSASQIRQIQAERVAAGRRGGEANRKQVASAKSKQTANPQHRTEQNTEGEKYVSSATGAEPPAVLTFPTSGQPATWGLTQGQIDAWTSAYPGVDILGECKRAQVWLAANTRKTASGMPRFLVSWLGRATNTPRPAVAASARGVAGSRTAGNVAALQAFVARHQPPEGDA